MNGLAPLSYPTFEAWSRLKGVTPEAREVDALMVLDSVLLNPGTAEDEA